MNPCNQNPDQEAENKTPANQTKEFERINNLLQIQIRLLKESNQEVENLKKENNMMKTTLSKLEEIKSKTVFENEQLRNKLTEYEQYLEIKEKHRKATELIANLWIENQRLKEILQKKQ